MPTVLGQNYVAVMKIAVGTCFFWIAILQSAFFNAITIAFSLSSTMTIWSIFYLHLGDKIGIAAGPHPQQPIANVVAAIWALSSEYHELLRR